MSSSNAGAQIFTNHPPMDGAIDMSSKVPAANKVSVIKNSSDQMQKFPSTGQTPPRNYSRTREKMENSPSKSGRDQIGHDVSGDLQFRIFGSEVVRKDASHPSNNSGKSHSPNKKNLNCKATNNHSQQQNSIFPNPDYTRTYQKCSPPKTTPECTDGSSTRSFNHQGNSVWKAARDPSSQSQTSNGSTKSPGQSSTRLLFTVRSDVAINSNDVKMPKPTTEVVVRSDDEIQEVYSISDEDSQEREAAGVEGSEVVSAEETGRNVLIQDIDPNEEEIYFICEDDNNEDEIEMVDEDEEEEEEEEGGDEEGRTEKMEVEDGDVSGSRLNGDARDCRQEEEGGIEAGRPGERSAVGPFVTPRRRRGRRPRNSLLQSQSRPARRREEDADSEEGSSRFSSPGRRRGRGRGSRGRGWSRGGRGSSSGKRARPFKRGTSSRTPDATGEEEECRKKTKRIKYSNMFIADKISSAVAAAASTSAAPTATVGHRGCLMEYQWPKGKSGEWYVLEEHVREFLGVVSFKRKYPDVSRRPVEYQERQHLIEQGCVTEMQCDLGGLTALKVDEVLDLMARDYPEKYQEYTKLPRRKVKVVAERPAEKASTEVQQPQPQASKADSVLKRAMKSATEFNSSLLRDRRAERQTYFDLQTLEIHHPIRRPPVKYSGVRLCDSYPVAVVPGQFQEYFKSYTPEELKYFPVNTALYAPHKVVQSIFADPVETVSDEEEDKTTANPSAGNSNPPVNGVAQACNATSTKSGRPRTSILSRFPALERSEIDLNGSDSNMSFGSAQKKNKKGGVTPGKSKKSFAQQPKCGMCGQTSRNKFNEADELVKCSSCALSNHPGCLGLSKEMVPVIKTYSWQCMECKTCFKCKEPHDEDKMMFCDHCDRGYHTYCVGVVSIPDGRWDCSMCAGKSLQLDPASSGQPPLEAPRPKPKRGRPFKYPRDENNVRIVLPTTTVQTPVKNSVRAEGAEGSPPSGSQSKASEVQGASEQKAASIESATNSQSTHQRATRSVPISGRNVLVTSSLVSPRRPPGSDDPRQTNLPG